MRVARDRVRAAVRKRGARRLTGWEQLARTIGSGVYSIVLELGDRRMPLPMPVTAPLVFVGEMLAAELAHRDEWVAAHHNDVSEYVFHQLQEATVALFERFDRAHCEAWMTALRMREEGDRG